MNSFDFISNDEECIEILNVGIYNAFQAGPDFKHGSILLNGIVFYGQIEMHVKSSDWYKHKHHKDVQYNNVILHVVYEHDQDVIQDGVKIPTIELKSLIDKTHYAQFSKKQFSRSTFPCEHEINEQDRFYLNSMKIEAITLKLNQKLLLIDDLNVESEEDVLYNLMGLTFSMSVNKDAFIHLMNNVSYHSIRNLSAQKKIQLILSESGILQHDKNSSQEFWHFKGSRPSSFPTIRVNQFAILVAHFSFELSFIKEEVGSIIKTFRSMIDLIDFSASNGKRKLSKNMIDLLIINTLSPFLWYLGESNEDERLKEKALEILDYLPPEKNNIINRWKKISIHPKNAFDSQSLLALYRYHCSRKKCLSCNVGQKVLNLE